MEFKNMNKKSLLLAGVACVLYSTSSFAGWSEFAKDNRMYVGADYVYDNYDFGGEFSDAKKTYNSGMINIGARMHKIGLEAFGQMSGERSKNMENGKLKTKVNVYGLDMYGYQPLGCEGKYDLLATIGIANYYYRGEINDTSDSKNRMGYRIGGGMMYNMTDHLSARVIGRYAYIGGKSLNHAAEVTTGLRYNF